MIKILLKSTNTIYIITDSFNIVNKFIYSYFNNNKNIILLDIDWINSFYLLLNASYVVMSSNSTFSYAAGFFNDKATYYLLEKKKNIFRVTQEEYAISPKWNIIKYNEKYVLNFNQNKIKLFKKYLHSA